MSVEPLNMSREKKRLFRAGKFPEDVITKDMIREYTCTVEWPQKVVSYKEFKVTEGMLFTNVPADFSPPLEYCDHLLEIENIKITSKLQMYSILRKICRKPGKFVEFKVRRIISCERITDDKLLPSNAAIRKPYSSDSSVKPNSGYTYFKVVLVYFPRSKLGVNIKSYQQVVYVESTDNTWGSTTRRFLYLGDAILKIDGTEVLDLKSTSAALRGGLQSNGIVTMIIERAVDQSANNFVRSVLNFRKGVDPHMAQDVIQACKAQLAHYNKKGFKPEPKGIWAGVNVDYSTYHRRCEVSKDAPKVSTIRSSQFNPATLMQVPDYRNITVTKD